jgi:hypothetical protein
LVKDEIQNAVPHPIRFIHDPALDEFSFLPIPQLMTRLGQINFYDFELLLYTRILTLVSNFWEAWVWLFKSQLFQ